MGCINSTSSSTGEQHRCEQCTRRVENKFERLCYPCTRNRRRATGEDSERPCFGEYRCLRCGRFWTSRLCWSRSYQICKRCRQAVYPHNCRELTPADKSCSSNVQEHHQEFCQKCQEVGYYCGNFAKLI